MSTWAYQRGKLTRFAVGDVISGVEVLELLNEARRAREQRYRVKRLCCGSMDVMTHESISHRRAQGQTLCKTCSTRVNAAKARAAANRLEPVREATKPKRRSRFTPFANGTEIGNAVVLASANREGDARNRLYRVRHLCCGEESVISHVQLQDRKNKHRLTCYACRSLQPIAGDWRAVAGRIDPVLRLALSGAWV